MKLSNIEFHEKDGSITFTVRITPRASKSVIVGELNGALKVKLSSPPIEGAANDELIRLLSKEFRVSRSSIEIVSGQTSRTKRVQIQIADHSRILAVLKAKS
jgi:uncharacterized protein